MKKIVVLGGGISGYGSAILARKKGFDVFLSDSGRIADRYKAKLDEWEVPYEEGGHTEERILAAWHRAYRIECIRTNPASAATAVRLYDLALETGRDSLFRALWAELPAEVRGGKYKPLFDLLQPAAAGEATPETNNAL